jgi:hypothetical protein
MAGYTLIQAESRNEALNGRNESWQHGRRDRGPAALRLEDFAPSEAIERFREMGVGRHG